MQKGAADKRFGLSYGFTLNRNRHLAEWRFLLFRTMIVTVKAPICNVIRMSLTPFRVVWLTAYVYVIPSVSHFSKFVRSCQCRFRLTKGAASAKIIKEGITVNG